MHHFNASCVVVDTTLNLGVIESGATGLGSDTVLALVEPRAATGHQSTESIRLVHAHIAAIQRIVDDLHRGSYVGGSSGSHQNSQAGKD